MAFIEILPYYLKFNDISLILKITFYLIILIISIYIVALCIGLISKLIISAQSQKGKCESKKLTVFFPCVLSELDKIDPEYHIFELKRNRIQITDQQGEGFIHCVRQKGKLFSRSFKLQLKNDCYEVFIDKENSNFVKGGFYISSKVDPTVLDQLIAEDCLSGSVPEVENGILYLHYTYLAVVKDTESLKAVLESRNEVVTEYSSLYFAKNISVTVYESLIASIFCSCPGDMKSICPGDNKYLTNQEGNFWINTPNGQAAVSLLSILPPTEVLGRKKVRENKHGNLNKQINCVLNYIKNTKGNATDNADFDYVLNFLKEQIWVNNRGVPFYNVIGENYPLIEDSNLRVKDLLRKDLPHNFLRYIFAIASYQDCEDVIETNELVRNLMVKFGFEYVIDKVHTILKDCLDKVIDIKSFCGNVSGDILTALSIDNDKEYTGKELIKHAREYLVKRYAHQISMIMERNVPIRVGPIESMVIVYPVENSQMLNNLLLDQVVAHGIPLGSNC